MARAFEATTSRPHTSGICLATSSHLKNKNMHACEHMAAERAPNRYNKFATLVEQDSRAAAHRRRRALYS